MNAAHWHLILNHSPIFGSLFGLLLLAAGLFRSAPILTQAGLLTLLLAAGLSIVTELTGHDAADVVRQAPGVTRALLGAHAAAGELANWALVATGAVAMLGLLLTREAPASASAAALWLPRLALLGALVSFGLLVRAGNLGGRIMHPETRPGYAPAPTQPSR